ncbi:unnamed protein product [Boreogadus saida]
MMDCIGRLSGASVSDRCDWQGELTGPPVAVEQQALNFGNGPLWSELERQEHQLMEQDCHQTALHTGWIGPGEELGPCPGHSCTLGLPLRSRRVDGWEWSRRKADDRWSSSESRLMSFLSGKLSNPVDTSASLKSRGTKMRKNPEQKLQTIRDIESRHPVQYPQHARTDRIVN